MEMTEKVKEIDVEQLRAEIRSPVKFLGEKLLADVADELLSLCVVGSALTEDFDPKRSDINTVLVVRKRSHRLLRLLAGYGCKMGKMKLRAPLLMTQEYIEQSLDVFGVEFLDFQFNHAVVYGMDPFEALSIRKEDVRLQCERQLKAALINLRQGYISGMGKEKIVGGLLLGCAGELVVLLRAMLWLVGAQRSGRAKEIMEKSAEKFGFQADKIMPLLELKQRHAQLKGDRAEAIFEDVYQIVDHLARRVDQLGKS